MFFRTVSPLNLNVSFCFQNHSVRCTESFARNNVIEEMSVMKVSKESQQHMLEALKRVRLDDDGRSILDDETFGDEGMGDDDLDDAQGRFSCRKR